MERQVRIQEILRDLEGRSPAGYALAFHIKYTAPDYLFQTYSSEWIDIYSKNGLVMQDPTVHWGFDNTGSIRWSDLADKDAAGVLAQAAEHGLGYGVCYATDAGGSRSVTSFARNDREFSDVEINEIKMMIDELHAMTSDLGTLSPETAAELHEMSIRFTHPGTSHS